MEFGITFKGDIDSARTVKLAQRAEEVGFDYIWSFDSHVLRQEVYVLLTLIAANTRRMRIGTLVTNPLVRDVTVTASVCATLQRVSGGRMQMGIGRGGSSRRVMGKRPATIATLETFVNEFRALTSGQTAAYEGTELRLTWADGGVPPVWVAGHGPKTLTAAGRFADGIVLQFGDPHLVKWCLGFVRAGAAQAGRDWARISIMAAAPVWIADDLAVARERVRWFPALFSNQVVDLLTHYSREPLPAELSAYVAARTGYDYRPHGEVSSANAEVVADEIVDRYCLVGPVPEQIRRLEELRALGVDQFNIYLMSGNEEDQVEVYGREILSNFKH